MEKKTYTAYAGQRCLHCKEEIHQYESARDPMEARRSGVIALTIMCPRCTKDTQILLRPDEG